MWIEGNGWTGHASDQRTHTQQVIKGVNRHSLPLYMDISDKKYTFYVLSLRPERKSTVDHKSWIVRLM